MSNDLKPVIAITMGDPAGIGPEIIVKALLKSEVTRICRPLVVGDRLVMERAIALAQADLSVKIVADPAYCQSEHGTLSLLAVTELQPSEIQYGKPSIAGGDAMFRYITEAAALCQRKQVSGMATAPINKEAMNRAGHHYPGHTELLAELTQTKNFVMMLAGPKLRVSLVTIHEAIAAVPGLLTFNKVIKTIRITSRHLERYFVAKPRIAVLALNPHCGEGGMFGTEDEAIIRPAVKAARAEGIDASGPLSADTLFHLAVQGEYDVVVCMYHDQGLIPLKLLHFDDGVNVTLGLPIIRTSVDHGTAYDLAGKGIASAESMAAAITMAAQMAIVNKAYPL